MRTSCDICDNIEDTRYFDLFTIGSEGTRLCHDCEMLVVEFIRDRQRAALRQRIAKRKKDKP